MVKSIKILLLLLIVGVTVLVPSVFAQEETTTAEETSTETSPTPSITALNRFKEREAIRDRIQNAREKNQEIRENIKERASASAQKRQEKLSQVRLKICEARQKNIVNRTKSMQERAKLIHKAHERAYSLADKFYTEKLVPNGYSLSNYADLKSEVEVNKANVTTLLESAKTSGAEFSCSSEDPKQQVDAFKEDMEALVSANKAYKTAIHSFVKAIRDLAKTARQEKLKNATPSANTEVKE